MSILQGKEENINALKGLWQTCFGDDMPYIDWCFDRRFLSDEILSLWKEKRLCGMTAQLTYPFYIQEEAVSCGFIEGLCTHPDFRYQHVATDLLKNSLQKMKETGRIFCFLVPFKVSYYTHQGFGIYNDLKRVHILMDHIPSMPLKKGERVEKIDAADVSLRECYQHCMKNYDSYTIREDAFWEHVKEASQLSGAQFYGFYRGEKLAGYWYSETTKNEIVVHEIVYEDTAAFLTMMHVVKTYAPGIQEAHITLSSRDSVYRLFADDKKAVCLSPYAMARIVDVEKVLHLYAKAFRTNTILHISDEMCPWNNGVFCIEGTTINRLLQKKADISMSVRTLLDILWGNVTPYEANILGKLSGDIEKIKGPISPLTSYVNLLFD